MGDPILENPGPVIPIRTQASFPEELAKALEQKYLEANIETDVREKLIGLANQIWTLLAPMIKGGV